MKKIIQAVVKFYASDGYSDRDAASMTRRALRKQLPAWKITVVRYDKHINPEQLHGKTERTRFQAGKGSKKKKPNTGRVLLDRYF